MAAEAEAQRGLEDGGGLLTTLRRLRHATTDAEREALRAKLIAARDRCAADARACAVEHPPERLMVRGFDVRIHRQTRNTIYAVGEDIGMCIAKLPTGVLVCTYRPPVEAGVAGPIIEGFCDKVRT